MEKINKNLEDSDKKLSPTEALERINSWRITTNSKIARASSVLEVEDLEKEAKNGIKDILFRTEKCNLLPEGWEKQNWEALSMTIAKSHLENETEPFYLF